MKFWDLYDYIKSKLAIREEILPERGRIFSLMFLADMQAYAELGKSITGVQWIKGPLYPIPKFSNIGS